MSFVEDVENVAPRPVPHQTIIIQRTFEPPPPPPVPRTCERARLAFESAWKSATGLFRSVRDGADDAYMKMYVNFDEGNQPMRKSDRS